jgi:foldase protein PrsA
VSIVQTSRIFSLLVGSMLVAGCTPDQPKPNSPPAPVAQNAHESATVQPVTLATDSSSASAKDEIVATVNNQPLTLRQLESPLIEGYGLNVLLNLAQLELARQEAAKQNITLSAEDFAAERDLTLGKMFKDASKEEHPWLLEQFLQTQRVSRPEFELVLQTNAYLRKIAEPKVLQQVGEAQLQEAFNSLYGETIQVRHIECANLQEIAEAKRRLAAGEKFDDIARSMSRNARTGPMGGELPPFSIAAAGYPKTFKEAAFELKKEGDVSEAVAVNNTYHLIKLEKRIPPRAVKFEDVKDSVREEVTDRLMQATIATMRQALASQTQAQLKIMDPVLKKQYDARVNDADKQIRDKQAAMKQLDRERERMNAEFNASTQATTLPAAPSSQPARAPVPAPATAPAGAATHP